MATIYVFIYFSGIKVVILGSFQFENNLSFKRHFGKMHFAFFIYIRKLSKEILFSKLMLSKDSLLKVNEKSKNKQKTPNSLKTMFL